MAAQKDIVWATTRPFLANTLRALHNFFFSHSGEYPKGTRTEIQEILKKYRIPACAGMTKLMD